MAAAEESKVTAVYVSQDGGQTPRKKRQRGVARESRRSPYTEAEPRTSNTAVAEVMPRGANSCATATGHDMLFVCAGDHLTEDRHIRACVPEKLMAEVDEATIVVVRSALPLRGRLIRSIEHRKKTWVPQLDRRDRIEVVRRMQGQAQLDHAQI